MKIYLFTTLVLLGTSIQAFEAKIELRHRESEGVGYNQGYSTVEFIGNQNWEKFELLSNVRGHIFNNGKLAGNIGLGVRKPLKSERYVMGLNTFYDVRETKQLVSQQIGLGWEFLSRRADLRINGYIPISKQSDFEQKLFSGFVSHTLYVKQEAKATLPCAEMEVGIPIKSIFYIAGGPYYLFQKNVRGLHTGQTWGGKLRATLNISKYLSVSAICTHDGIFDTRFQGYISINIPLNNFKIPKSVKRNLRDVPISRNEIIPIQSKHRKIPFSETNSKSSLTSLIFVNNTFQGKGQGTFEEPFSSLKEAEKASKPGDILYVFPGDGTANKMNEGIVLKEGQILTSSKEPLELDELIIPAQTPDRAPVITNIHPGEPIIEGSFSPTAFMLIDQSDYILPDWDSPSYDIVDLLGGDETGNIIPDFASPVNLDDIAPFIDDGSDTNSLTDASQLESESEGDEGDYVMVNDSDLEMFNSTDAGENTSSGWWFWR